MCVTHGFGPGKHCFSVVFWVARTGHPSLGVGAPEHWGSRSARPAVSWWPLGGSTLHGGLVGPTLPSPRGPVGKLPAGSNVQMTQLRLGPLKGRGTKTLIRGSQTQRVQVAGPSTWGPRRGRTAKLLASVCPWPGLGDQWKGRRQGP